MQATEIEYSERRSLVHACLVLARADAIALVDAKADASGIEAQAQVTILHEVMDADDGGGEARSCGEAERPAGAEPVGDEADNRRADRRAAQSDREPDRHDASAHRGRGGYLHQAVGRVR